MLKNHRFLLSSMLLLSFLFIGASGHHVKEAPRRLEILFLGHKSKHHDSERLADILTAEYFKQGINISYTTDPNDLNEATLKPYDGLIVYANYDTISRSQEKALLSFVKEGKGFIALHSASFCFRNSPEVVEMIGGQFKSHRYDSFPAVIVKPEHPVMEHVPSFITYDETYVHDKISKNIQVLSERVEGSHREPYTWVRPFGAGRVFYTAYGHDEKTFTNAGFLKLVHNGIMWAVSDQARESLSAYKLADPTYYDGPVPNYEKKDPAPKVQQSLTPEQSMSLIQVPVGFDLQLFAAEPMVVNPIYMNWDERGRLWVIETVDYPNEIKDEDKGDDRIKILEDTDGDGKADKTTIFADKLNIPTSFTFVNGGIIVSMAPNFLFLKDTNGDDKADVRQPMLKGWGKRDTHAQASNLRYGLDNMIWGVVGYSGFEGKVGKDTLRFGQGVYRFTPDGKQLEYLSTTSNNTWGLGFSEEFDVFISTANNTHTGFLGLPKRYFDKAGIRNETGVEKLDAHYGMHVATKNLRQVDVHGGFTAAAGHSLYTARNFPKEYWNRIAFVTEPTGRLIHRTVLEKNGAGFKEAGDGWNMLASADEWAAPIQAEVGPDGALWITDWYDFIIQHNPTPSVASSGLDAKNGQGNAYINPLRDHERGRIYRLTYKGNDQKNSLSLSKNDTRGLVSALSDKNMFWRLTAQRLLVEKGDKSVLPALIKLADDSSPDEIGVDAPAVHALWTMHGLNAFNGTNKEALAVATKGLSNSSAGVRKAAIEVLPKNTATLAAMTKAKVFNDVDYRVRMAALLAIIDMKPSLEIGNLLVSMAEKEENLADAWLKQALIIGSKLNEQGFRAASKSRGLKDNAPLSQASIVQRLIFGSRLNTVPLRRTFGRQQQAESVAPDVSNKEFLLSGELERMQPRPGGNAPQAPGSRSLSGVIATQGNRQNGYSLYILDNKMYFQVNQAGKFYSVVTPKELPARFAFRAGLDKDGAMRLYIDSNEVATAKTAGLFKAELPLPMRIGLDNRKGEERVVDYPDSVFILRANITRQKLETLGKETAAATAAAGATGIDKTIILNVVKDVMKFDKQLITAKAGTTIRIVLQNPDFMQHNFVLIKPNTSNKVGAAADLLARDGDGAKVAYVPKMTEVLAATPLVNPAGKYTLTIKLPDIPGDYPYLCTFPGHWRIMNGILRVTK